MNASRTSPPTPARESPGVLGALPRGGGMDGGGDCAARDRGLLVGVDRGVNRGEL